MKMSPKEYALLTLFILGGLAAIGGPYWSSVERGTALAYFGVVSPGSGASTDEIKNSIAGVSSSLRRAQYGLSIGALGAVLLVVSLGGLWYNLRKQVINIMEDQS